MSDPRIVASYRIETPLPLERAAESLAGEQSTGTFTKVPGETPELHARHGARVERITPLERVDRPTLPGAVDPPSEADGPAYQRAEVRISFPLDNVGANLPTLVATVAGNLFELRQFSGLRLLDLELPDELAASFPGPAFGVEGTRRLAGVHDRPIIGTIVKPSVGLTPSQTADLVRQLAEAGADFVKDDELMANPPHSPLAERVRAIMPVIEEAADRTGRKLMYAFNISDSLEAMLGHHDTVLKAGGTCVMVSLNSVGLAGVEHLRRRAQLPIHGHRNGWGMLSRCPELGMEFAAYQQLWRLAGADHLHVNGLSNKFAEPDESVVRSIRAMRRPLLGGCFAMPVISSGQWGGQAPETYRRTGTLDVMYLAGGGMLAHPGGAAGGVAAIRQAWEAAVAGVELNEYARDHEELRRAIEHFGRMDHVRAASARGA